MPITDVMIDNTCGYECMSFIDGFSGYSLIKIYSDDEKHASFRTPVGVYCCMVMPFGLKNASATYQRAISKIFQQHICKMVMCCMDDIVIKSQAKENHLPYLREVFDLMCAHQLNMYPAKSFTGVSIEKFLGFIVTSKGIHLDPEKIHTIQEMQPPRFLLPIQTFFPA